MNFANIHVANDLDVFHIPYPEKELTNLNL